MVGRAVGRVLGRVGLESLDRRWAGHNKNNCMKNINRFNKIYVYILFIVGAQSVPHCRVGAELVPSRCRVGALSVPSRCPVDAQSVPSWCQVGAQSVPSRCPVNAQSVPSGCPVGA